MYIDYVVDEKCRETTPLLDDDMHQPNSDLTDSADIALSEIAAVIHRNARLLQPWQLEQVVGWVKRWKLRDEPPSRGSRFDFFEVLDRLRDSHEQKQLQRAAIVQYLWAGLASAAFVFAAIATVAAMFADEVSSGWKLGLFVLDWVLFAVADTKMRAALAVAKEQDRKFGLQSLRHAQTIMELNQAGLFAYLPCTDASDPRFDDELARSVMREEVDRLTDALYTDPDAHLRYHDYPWLTGEERASGPAIGHRGLAAASKVPICPTAGPDPRRSDPRRCSERLMQLGAPSVGQERAALVKPDRFSTCDGGRSGG